MFQPWHALAGEKPRPQFFLRDQEGREFGVVEHYENRRLPPPAQVALEFVSADFAAKRPWVLFDLEIWRVVAGRSQNLPDAIFEAGLEYFLGRWPESEKQLRRDRARLASCKSQIDLAGQGYTIAFFELFPAELGVEGLPFCSLDSGDFLVEDQYGIRPGEFRDEVTLVLLPAKNSAIPIAAANPSASPGPQAIAEKPYAIVNWRFGQGFDLLDCHGSEDAVAEAVQNFMAVDGREALYRERLMRMRREGVLLGVKPNLSVT